MQLNILRSVLLHNMKHIKNFRRSRVVVFCKSMFKVQNSPYLHIYLLWIKSIEILDNLVCKLYDNQRTIRLCLLLKEISAFEFGWGSVQVKFEDPRQTEWLVILVNHTTFWDSLVHLGKYLFKSKGLRPESDFWRSAPPARSSKQYSVPIKTFKSSDQTLLSSMLLQTTRDNFSVPSLKGHCDLFVRCKSMLSIRYTHTHTRIRAWNPGETSIAQK